MPGSIADRSSSSCSTWSRVGCVDDVLIGVEAVEHPAVERHEAALDDRRALRVTEVRRARAPCSRGPRTGCRTSMRRRSRRAARRDAPTPRRTPTDLPSRRGHREAQLRLRRHAPQPGDVLVVDRPCGLLIEPDAVQFHAGVRVTVLIARVEQHPGAVAEVQLAQLLAESLVERAAAQLIAGRELPELLEDHGLDDAHLRRHDPQVERWFPPLELPEVLRDHLRVAQLDEIVDRADR